MSESQESSPSSRFAFIQSYESELDRLGVAQNNQQNVPPEDIPQAFLNCAGSTISIHSKLTIDSPMEYNTEISKSMTNKYTVSIVKQGMTKSLETLKAYKEALGMGGSEVQETTKLAYYQSVFDLQELITNMNHQRVMGKLSDSLVRSEVDFETDRSDTEVEIHL